ncbi:MAG: hypothetical protein RR425_04475, partial [Erysipelotrichales bacterium]
MLEGPIKLPKEWKNKVSVMYSTTQTPKTVGVLDKDTHYPKDATHLKDAKEAKDATWINAKDVSDWSKIRSFKVETIGNVDWIDGSTKEINYQLHLPKNYKIGKKEVKSYNSFSVATNNLQPTETKDVVVSLQKKKIPKTGSSNTFISINLILVSALAFVMLKRIEEI